MWLRVGVSFGLGPGNAVCAWADLGMAVFPTLSPALDALLSNVFPEWTPGTYCSLSPVLPLARLAVQTLDPHCRLAFSCIYGIISFPYDWAPCCVWHSWWTLSLTPGSAWCAQCLWDCASWTMVCVVLGVALGSRLPAALLFLALHLQSFVYSWSAEYARVCTHI